MEAKSPSLIVDELFAVVLNRVLLDTSDRGEVPIAVDVLGMTTKVLFGAFEFVLEVEVGVNFRLPDLHAKNGLKSLLRISGGLRQYT